MEFDSKKLEIGSRVLVKHFNYGGYTESLGVVEKITPSGLVDVRSSKGLVRYKRNGTEYYQGNLYSRTRLSIPTKEDIERVVLAEQKAHLVRSFGSRDWSKYPLEKLLKIQNILGEA